MLYTFDIPSWVYQIVEHIESSNYAKVELAILPKSHTQTKDRSGLSSIIPAWYLKFDKKKYDFQPSAFALKNCEGLLANAQILSITSKEEVNSNEIINKITKQELDVLLKFGFDVLRGAILTSAKYGVWAYRHGNPKVSKGQLAGFWEVMSNHPVSETRLERLSANGTDNIVLDQTFSSTNPYSVNLNRHNLYWSAAAMVNYQLKALHQLGGDLFTTKYYHTQFNQTNAQQTVACISNLEVIFPLLKFFSWKIYNRLREAFYNEQWFLLFALKKEGRFSSSMHQYKKIAIPKDRIWADPFIVYKEKTYYIFFEEMLFSQDKGFISYIKMEENGHFSKAQKVIEQPYHLSYPFIFEWEGAYYMIPETKSNRTVDLYKCDVFPDKWVHHKTIFADTECVDTTLLEQDGKWWMFTTLKERAGNNTHDKLFLYYTDNPVEGDWIAHPQNPILSDVRKARPAGKIVKINNKIYRPSQDCSVTYGYAIKFNEILVLNKEKYQENEVDSITPSWEKGLCGTHTYAHEKELSVIDAWKYRSKFF